MKYINYNLKKSTFSYRVYDSLKIFQNLLTSKRYPLIKNELSCTPFFIIGSGRSGNTLLRAILTNHSEISIPPESYVLPQMVRKYQSFKFLEWKDLTKIIVGELESHPQFFTWELNLSPLYQRIVNLPIEYRSLANIIDEIYQYYAEIKFPEASVWGDKTPLNTLNLKWINKVFPNAKYIHIIRDGRDVINSYKKAGLLELDEATMRWKNSIKEAKQFSKNIPNNNYLEIKYEDLVTNTNSEIVRVCNFLNLDFTESMLNYYNNFSRLGDVSKLKHHQNLGNKINEQSIGKWKEDEYKKEIISIEYYMENELIELGYK